MHHSRLAAGCHFGSSLIQNGSQLIFGGGELTPVIFRGSDPLHRSDLLLCSMPFLGSRFIQMPRCCTWARSWSSGPGFVNWLPQESIMKRPFFGAQFWKSNTTRRHHQVLSRAFPPECLQCAPCPARRWVASAVVKAAGAFASRLSGLTLEAGVSPAQAWEDFHSHEVPRLAAVDVLNLASGLWPTDLLPDHINKLLRHVESQSHPRGATPAQLWVVWRHWQQGRQVWRKRAYEGLMRKCSGPSCPLAPAGRPGLRDGGAARSLP